ncbi:MAG: formate dehydrogenase accessory sulfurtransferase FdhD [Planctomycetaceae bacterium]|nr:formate dehydrogenase accessory sulfurtransferase FdhD [Planctomycetaceae bacterium]
MSIYDSGVTTVAIASVDAGDVSSECDEVSVEEPLEIDLIDRQQGHPLVRSIAVTMRTPGHDIQLAAGFLFSEGIIRDADDIVEIHATSANIVQVTLKPTAQFDPARLDRHSFVSSSCGVCGKRSIAAVFALKHHELQPGFPKIQSEIVNGLPRAQRAAQANFRRTGGIHATALFDESGHLLSVYEDVGRHNALDKMIGAELLAGRLPLSNRLVLVSGRASFELIQKASLAGIPVLAAVGAPSSLAVSLARQSSMTLLGFVRDDRFNVYADAGRLTEAPAGLFARNVFGESTL